jgi:hypothetical protein
MSKFHPPYNNFERWVQIGPITYRTRWCPARCCGNLVLTWKELIEWEIVKSRKVMLFLLESSMGWNVFYDIWKWIIYALLSELGSIFEEHWMNKPKSKVAETYIIC